MSRVSTRSVMGVMLLAFLLVVIAPMLPPSGLQSYLVRGPLLEISFYLLLLFILSVLLENEKRDRFTRSLLFDNSVDEQYLRYGVKRSKVVMPEVPPRDADETDEVGETFHRHRRSPWTPGWPMLGFLFLVGCLYYLERSQPFFFTQDDNLAQFLPVILQGCRSLEHGVFPTWNPYQFMGAPTADLGVYALTYPPTYLSYFAAKNLFHNPYLTLDVFCISHLVVGYFTTYRVCRSTGFDRGLSVTGSLCLALSGYMLMAGRSWYYMTPVLVWTPLLMLTLVRLQRRRAGWRWVIETGLIIGFYFHAGNAQMWVYGMMFWIFAAALMLWSGRIRVRDLGVLAAALCFGLGIASPLLVPEIAVTAQVARPHLSELTLQGSVSSLFLPLPAGMMFHPSLTENAQAVHFTQLYYSGSLFYGVCILALAAAILYRDKRRVIGNNVWLVCAVLAFFLALGNGGGIHVLLSKLPPFNKFQHPFKYIAYMNLFTVMGGGTVLQRLLARLSSRTVGEIFIFIPVWGLLLFHCTLTKTALYWYGDRPYPRLPAEMAQILKGDGSGATLGVESGRLDGNFPHPSREAARVMSFAPLRSPEPGFIDALHHNYPTLWGVFGFGGYDPLVEFTPEYQLATQQLKANPLGAARAYGVRWLIIHRLVYNTVHGPQVGLRDWETADASQISLLKSLDRDAVRRLDLPNLSVWELPSADPMAFPSGQPQHSLAVRFDGQEAVVDLEAVNGNQQIVVNVLRRPAMIATADGRRLPTRSDAWGRLVVVVPSGARILKVRYAPAWMKGLLVGMVMICAGAILTLMVKRCDLSTEGRDASVPVNPDANESSS